MEACLAHDPFLAHMPATKVGSCHGLDMLHALFLHARFIFIKKAQMGTEGIWVMAAAVD